MSVAARRYDLFSVPLSFAELRNERLARLHACWPVLPEQQYNQVGCASVW